MSELLKKHSTSSAKAASAPLLVRKKVAVDALLTEMARPGVGTTYDRDYQTEHENPFADKRFDSVPTAPDPKEASVDLQTGQVDNHERHYAPKEQDVRSKSTKKEMKDEAIHDGVRQGSLLVAKHNYDFEGDKDRKIAHKVASNRYFKQFVTANNIKAHNDILMVNIPRGKVAHAEFGPMIIAQMERELSNALNVRAKYAHVVLNASFDGVSFEFMLV